MDAPQWRETANGNLSILLIVKGAEYRVVLFKHKKHRLLARCASTPTPTSRPSCVDGAPPVRRRAWAHGASWRPYECAICLSP
jgi:hypothetical protein